KGQKSTHRPPCRETFEAPPASRLKNNMPPASRLNRCSTCITAGRSMQRCCKNDAQHTQRLLLTTQNPT
ncbi:hypothetical protein NDU88_011654, partial [Pleurodeles waltl]